MEQTNTPDGQQENNKPETVEKLTQELNEFKKKHGDLNLGIANIRDDRNKYRDENQTLKQRVQELETVKPIVPDTVEDDIEQKIVATADKLGFVKREDLLKEKQEQATEQQKTVANNAYKEFVTNHPEYESDENWTKVTQAFNDGMFRAPVTLEEHRKVYNKIHNSLSGVDQKEQGKQEAKAEAKTKSRLSLGGGSQGASSGDATIENLKKKYPSLTEEQIRTQLSEVEELYPNVNTN